MTLLIVCNVFSSLIVDGKTRFSQLFSVFALIYFAREFIGGFFFLFLRSESDNTWKALDECGNSTFLLVFKAQHSFSTTRNLSFSSSSRNQHFLYENLYFPSLVSLVKQQQLFELSKLSFFYVFFPFAKRETKANEKYFLVCLKLFVFLLSPLFAYTQSQFFRRDLSSRAETNINLIAKPRRDDETFFFPSKTIPRSTHRRAKNQKLLQEFSPSFQGWKAFSRFKFTLQVELLLRRRNDCRYCSMLERYFLFLLPRETRPKLTPVLSHAKTATDQIWLLLNKFYLLCRVIVSSVRAHYVFSL